jgi:hypothetical protein
MDRTFCYQAACVDPQIEFRESDAGTPDSLFIGACDRVNKKQPFRRSKNEKNRAA